MEIVELFFECCLYVYDRYFLICFYLYLYYDDFFGFVLVIVDGVCI